MKLFIIVIGIAVCYGKNLTESEGLNKTEIVSLTKFTESEASSFNVSRLRLARDVYGQQYDDSKQAASIQHPINPMPAVVLVNQTRHVRQVVYPAQQQSFTGVIQCIPQNGCYSNVDCGGKRCVGGALIGKCNCAACIQGKACANDGACGGLRGGCDLKRGKCFCNLAFRQLGFATRAMVNLKFCNHQVCTGFGAEGNCFGLPCHAGRCNCA